MHANPVPKFYCRHGSYRARCRREPVPRYRCKSCRRRFSRQTFRHDYRDRRPECNQRLFEMLVSGTGLRQAADRLGLGVQSVQKKMEKLALTCGLLHRNLSRRLPAGGTYVMDEEETYETSSIKTLTLPILIEKETWFVVSWAVGSIRRLARQGTARRRWQDHVESMHGRRLDQSRACVRQVLCDLDSRIDGRLILRTDRKASYASVAREVFGARVVHETTAGTEVRSTHNPLFPINHTIAMTRDNCGRLRRKSWLVTKAARRLRHHMALFAVFRNYVRQRFRRDRKSKTPAWFLGLLPRNILPLEALRWRQDWGERSPHPLSACGGRSFLPCT